MKVIILAVSICSAFAQSPVLEGLQRGIMLGTMMNANRTMEAEQRKLEAETRKLEQQAEKLRRQQEREDRRAQPQADKAPGVSEAEVAVVVDSLQEKYADFKDVYSIIEATNQRLRAKQLPLEQLLEVWYFGVKYGLRTNLESDRALVTEFPALLDTSSELFKATQTFFTREVSLDPGAVKNPRILRLCVELAQAQLRNQ